MTIEKVVGPALVAAVLCLVLAVPFLQAFLDDDPYDGLQMGRKAEDFTLRDPWGKEVSLHDFQGREVYLYFGFSRCTGACPKSLGAFYQLVTHIDDPDVNFLFVNINPDLEQGEYLQAYSEGLSSRVLVLTGTRKELRRIISQYYGYMQERASFVSNGNGPEHSSFIYFIDRLGELRFVYPKSAQIVTSILMDRQRFLKEMEEERVTENL